MERRVRKWLQALRQEGYEAYLVGGAVRDMLLHRKPHDYDIVTQARPEEIKQVAQRHGWSCTTQPGEVFGIVTVQVEGLSLETATYRKEVYGKDSHRPSDIWYATTLQEDMLRRDFTINALAMTAEGRILDYVGGQRDLKEKRLATVGDPVRRFREDGLRLFRACRLVGQLGFTPEASLVQAMPQALSRVAGISLQRAVQEGDRLLLTPYAAEGLQLWKQTGLAAAACRSRKNGVEVAVPIFPELVYGVSPADWQRTLAYISHLPGDLTLRYAALFHPFCGTSFPPAAGNVFTADSWADIPTQVLRRWGKAAKEVRRILWLVQQSQTVLSLQSISEEVCRRWWCREIRQGVFKRKEQLLQAVQQMCAMVRVMAAVQHLPFYERRVAVATRLPVETKDLLYSSALVQYCGKDTGACLQYLLRQVQEGRLHNTASVLEQAAVQWRQQYT